MRKIKYKGESNQYKKLFIVTLIFSFSLLGALLNLEAVNSNGGKMPVLSSYHYGLSTHFSYQDKDEVENWYLTDIFPIGNDSVYSIGDFLLISSLALLVFIFLFDTVYWIKKKRKLNRIERRLKK